MNNILTSGGLIYLAICFYFFCYSSTRDDLSYTVEHDFGQYNDISHCDH